MPPVAGQQSGGGFADVADAQGKDQPIQRDLPPGLDRGEQPGSRGRTIAIAVLQLFQRVGGVSRGQGEDVGGASSRAGSGSAKKNSTCFSPGPRCRSATR
jgi:hypothetical protein